MQKTYFDLMITFPLGNSQADAGPFHMSLEGAVVRNPVFHTRNALGFHYSQLKMSRDGR